MRPLLMLVAVASNIVPTPGQSSLPATLSTQPTITITSAYLSTLSGPSTTVTASSSTSSFTESSNDTSIVGDRFAHHNYRPPYSGSSGGSSGSGSSSGGNKKGGSNYGGFTHGGSNNGGFSSGGSGGGNYGPGGHGSHGGHKRNPLHLDYGWKFMDFIFPSASARREAIRSGAYNYTSIIPLDMDVWEKAGRRKVFVTMPTGPGSPVSLGTVSREQGFDNGPLIAPYPDWSWHRRGDCNSISSVYRVAIDDYDRLWVMDRGDDKNCLPKVMAFDLNTDKLISKYEISRNLLQDRPSSNLITPVVDVRDHGRNTFVYIADVIGAIIVYDHQNRQAWRVIHPLFLPDLRYANHTIAGTNFYLADGLFGMALSPLRCEGHGKPAHGGQVHGAHVQGNGRCEEDRTLYFHALASIRENYVKTSVLRNRNNFPNLQNKAQSAFKSFDGVRPSVSAAEAMTDKGVLFSGLLPDVAVTCWNSRESFGGWNLHVVAQDEEKLQFTSGMKVRYGKLYVFSSRYQRFATNTMNWNEVNYRIQSGCVDDLTRGTKCEPKSSINS